MSITSSKQWAARQNKDPFVRRARLEAYRCRSAFKLIQLEEAIPGGILKPGKIVIDLGAAPGSWSQVAIKRVREDHKNFTYVDDSNGTVVGVDLLHFDPIPGVLSLPLTDLLDTDTCITRIRQTLGENLQLPVELEAAVKNGAFADVVICDIAPNCSGIREIDVPAIHRLAERAIRLALNVSRTGANIVIKLWKSNSNDKIHNILQRLYHGNDKSSKAVHLVKPKASRSESSEIYLVGIGFDLKKFV